MRYKKLLGTLFFIVFAFMAMASASDCRGFDGDGWADIIIGQPSFNDTTPYAATDDKLWLPHGVIVDTSDEDDQKIYVYDAGNSRILGIDLEDCYADIAASNTCTATLVLGQTDENGDPTFTESTCNDDSSYEHYPYRYTPRADTLCGQRENGTNLAEGGSGSSMALDAAGNLYHVDFWNHRVLRFNTPFAPGEDMDADYVWGQADFTKMDCNRGNGTPAADTFCFGLNNTTFGFGPTQTWTGGVDIDSAGNMWVVDVQNHRVLRFPDDDQDGVPDSTADLVLGQTTFSAMESAEGDCHELFGSNRLWGPSVVRVNDSGRVYVADTGCNRVVYFDPPFDDFLPFSNSHCEFGDGTGFCWDGGMGVNGAQGIDFDPTEPDRVWIFRKWHSLWSDATWSLYDEADADNDNPTLIARIGAPGDNNQVADGIGSLGIDVQGNILVAIGSGVFDNTLLVIDKVQPQTDPPVYKPVADWKKAFSWGTETSVTDRDLGGATTGVAVWEIPTDAQMFVSQASGIGSTGRVLFWNKGGAATLFDALQTYEAADGYLRAGIKNNGFKPTLPCCDVLKVDDANQLWGWGYPNKILCVGSAGNQW